MADLFKPPSPPTVPVDPNLAAEQQQAQQDLVGATQTQTQSDMASLMARYGTQLALAGSATSPLVSARTGGLSKS